VDAGHSSLRANAFQFSGFEVLNMALAVGNYTFYFAVDPSDGQASGQSLDSVEVEVKR
jgi:hypothetical protein